MVVLKEKLSIVLSILACILIVACTAINFEETTEEEENPVIELANEKDTITVGDTYSPNFTVEDNKDSTAYLLNNVDVWIEDKDGEVLDIEAFTENPGIYYVFLNVTDSDGNKSDTISGIVIVSEEDKTAPVITLFGPSPFLLNIGDEYFEPGARAVDNFDGDVSDHIEISGDIVNTITECDFTITYRVSDKSGNEATAKRTVTVKDSDGDDKEKPVITILGDNPFSLYIGETYKDPGAEATDNEDGNLTSKIEVFGASINTSIADTYKVYYTVDDAAGNIATEIRAVIVQEHEDTIPPVITLLGDNPMNLDKEQQYIEPGATAEDNVDGDLTDEIDIDDDEVNIYENGIYKVYYTVSDAASNETEETRTVIVGIIDSISPVITLLGDNPMIVDYMGTYKEPGAYAKDSVGDVVDSIPFSQFTVDKDINVNVLGMYKVTYTVSDESGNETSAEREVEVADTIAPVITLNGPNPINLDLNYPYTEHGATAMDNYDGDLTDQLDTVGDVNSAVGGVYIITYTVPDQHGNVGTGERTVNVALETDPPVLTLLGDNPMDLKLGDPYIEPGATAWDSVDGDVTDKIAITGDVNTDSAGTYTVHYSVSDTQGNEASDDRIVNVIEDTIPPVLTLNGSNPMDLATGAPYNEPGATAIDNFDGDISGEIVIDGEVITILGGTYTVTYTVSDDAQNEVSKDRTVNVAHDNDPPVITLIGNNPMVIMLNDSYNEPGATADDDVDGDLTSKIVISGSVDTATLGSYTITYTVSDTAGNVATENRTVNVAQDVTPPVITLKGNNPMTLELGDTYNDPGATATDDVDGDITSSIVVGGDVVNTSAIGTYIVTYNVSDNAGNAAVEKTRTVEVVDQIIPDWRTGINYQIGDLVTYGGQIYRCIQSHLSSAGWEPPNAASLWQLQ